MRLIAFRLLRPLPFAPALPSHTLALSWKIDSFARSATATASRTSSSRPNRSIISPTMPCRRASSTATNPPFPFSTPILKPARHDAIRHLAEHGRVARKRELPDLQAAEPDAIHVLRFHGGALEHVVVQLREMAEDEEIDAGELLRIEFLVPVEGADRRQELRIQGTAREAAQVQDAIVSAPRNLDESGPELAGGVSRFDP